MYRFSKLQHLSLLNTPVRMLRTQAASRTFSSPVLQTSAVCSNSRTLYKLGSGATSRSTSFKCTNDISAAGMLNPNVFKSSSRVFSTHHALNRNKQPSAKANTSKPSNKTPNQAHDSPNIHARDAKPSEPPVENSGLMDKIKARLGKSKMVGYVKEYGITFLIWYECVWLGGFGVLSCAIHLGVIGGADGLELLTSVGVDKLVSLDSLDPKMGSAVVAAGFNELLEPIRLPLVIRTTPWIKEKVANIIAIYRK